MTAIFGKVKENPMEGHNDQIARQEYPPTEIRSASTTLERGDSEALIQELLAALKKAHYELNSIRARDGVPYQAHTAYGSIRSDVDEKYFSDVVDECSAAIVKAGGRP